MLGWSRPARTCRYFAAAEGVVALHDDLGRVERHGRIARIAERIGVGVVAADAGPETAGVEFPLRHHGPVAGLVARFAGIQRRVADHDVALFAQLQRFLFHVVGVDQQRGVAGPEPGRRQPVGDRSGGMFEDRRIGADEFDVVLGIGSRVQSIAPVRRGAACEEGPEDGEHLHEPARIGAVVRTCRALECSPDGSSAFMNGKRPSQRIPVTPWDSGLPGGGRGSCR